MTEALKTREMTIRLDVDDKPATEGTLLGGTFLPESVELTYMWSPGKNWEPSGIRITGEHTAANFGKYRGSSIKGAPKWAREIARQYLPEAAVRMTSEELDALPEMSVVLMSNDKAFQKEGKAGWWYSTGFPKGLTSEEVARSGKLRISHIPALERSGGI